MTDNARLNIGATYRHYKGNLYVLKDIAKVEDKKSEYVAVYQELGEGKTYVRPVKEFKEKFTLDPYSVEHSIDCLYEFELAFLNIEDTPQQRLLFWSSKGGLKFNDKDQVIPPEYKPDECPCQTKTKELPF